MRKPSWTIFATLVAASASLWAQDSAPLRKLRTLNLSSAIRGPFDHLAVDQKHKVLFATPEDYKAVLVIDLGSGKLIHEIPDISRPHAILYRDDLDRLYVTDGIEGALKIYDGTSYQRLQSIPLAKDADSIGNDITRNLLYIDNGGKDEGKTYSFLSIVDTTSGKKISDIKIEGDMLEAMTLDVFRPRMYLNNKAKNEVEVIDRWKGAQIASWPVALCRNNVAMGLDEQHQRLFVACRDGKVAVFDSNTGQELQALAITPGVDDLTYDPATKRIYAAGSGTVSVLEQIDADHYRPLGDVQAGPAARTALLVSALNRYYVAVPQHDSQNASIVEMEPIGIPAPKTVENPVLPVGAPAAENLLLATMSAHPYLRKMGLHGTPSGQTDSVILANANSTRIGVKTTQGDFDAVKEGKTSCARREDGAYYNMKMPMLDAANRRIGILVMEIPFSAVKDEASAIRRAEELRSELSRQIPSFDALFQYALDVSAPQAQRLVNEAMAANPALQKIGVHVTKPGSQDNVIIASNIQSKIGKRSSDADRSVMLSGKPTVARANGTNPFYDLALPLHDAGGNSIGMIVMELRASAAKDESDALQQAQRITDGLEKRIRNQQALFSN
jgi:DNA-binding beta-propeller fold protein YncE